MNILLVTFCSDDHLKKNALEFRNSLFSALRRISTLTIIPSDQYIPSSTISMDDDVTIFFIASGGTEYKFMELADKIPSPIILLCDGYFNSLAAGMEIASYLQQKGIEHELLNIPMAFKDLDFLQIRISCVKVKSLLSGFTDSIPDESFTESFSEPIYHNESVRNALSKSVIGLIGGEAKWLISSHIDKKYLEETFHARFVDIPLQEVIDGFNSYHQEITVPDRFQTGPSSNNEIMAAIKMANVLENICITHSLTAMTVNCFDLIPATGTSACMAMSILDEKGYITGCEGDIPSLWTKIVAKEVYGKSAFFANPASSLQEESTIDFAHCTAPFSLLKEFTLPSHFESGKGIGIAGIIRSGRYMLMKIGGKRMEKILRFPGIIICNTSIPQRCRTQIRFKFDDPKDYEDFFKSRLGNHILLVPLF